MALLGLRRMRLAFGGLSRPAVANIFQSRAALAGSRFVLLVPVPVVRNGFGISTRAFSVIASPAHHPAISKTSTVDEVCDWVSRKVAKGGIGLTVGDVVILQREQITGSRLFAMTDAELKHVGMSLRARKKLLDSIARLADLSLTGSLRRKVLSIFSFSLCCRILPQTTTRPSLMAAPLPGVL